MKKLLWFMRSSAEELKSVSTVSVAGMLVAIGVVLSFVKIVLSPVLEISFSFLPLAAGGLLYGPVVGGIMGILTDVLGYFIRPNGPFFPGFTLSALISGVLYGLFLYKKPVTLTRAIVVSALVTVFINLGLTSLWLSMMYGKAFVVLLTARIVKNLIVFPINTALLMALLKFIERFRIRGRLAE
ncbi:MAG: folate family ECF transporter S component [Caldiserica bacterium]|nr:folate family ECF transporter S component [Caldisericota bacterium]